jgi:PAS domain S-box-containing protein
MQPPPRRAPPSVGAPSKGQQNAIITINDKGIIQSIDRNASTLFGYDLDELHGKKVNILIPPPYKEQHDTYIANYLQTGIKRIIDKRRLVEGLHKDGSIFPIILSVTEVKVWNVQMYIGAIERVEDKSVIINADATGIITSCNNKVDDLIGYTAPELVGKSISLLVPAPHHNRHDSYIQQGNRAGVLGHVRNLPIKHKNGVVFPVCLQVKQLNTSGVLTFRASIELPPKETVLTIDEDGAILSCNFNYTLPMFGYPQQSLIGKNVRFVFASTTPFCISFCIMCPLIM